MRTAQTGRHCIRTSSPHRAAWHPHASTATAAPTKAPKTRARPCRPPWTGRSGWWSGWARDGTYGFRVI